MSAIPAEHFPMRMPRPGLVATLLLSGMCARAAAAPPALADCDGAEVSPVRTAATVPEVPPKDARALWLDGRLIRWPGAPGDGRYRLHHSAQARLQATPGGPVQGADGALLLEDPARALPPPPLPPRSRRPLRAPRTSAAEPSVLSAS